MKKLICIFLLSFLALFNVRAEETQEDYCYYITKYDFNKIEVGLDLKKITDEEIEKKFPYCGDIIQETKILNSKIVVMKFTTGVEYRWATITIRNGVIIDKTNFNLI